MADASLTVQANFEDHVSSALKFIQNEMARLEHITHTSTGKMGQDLAALRSGVSTASGAFGGLGKSVLAWTGGLLAGGLAVRGFIGVVNDSLAAARSQIAADKDLEATLKSTGNQVGYTVTQLKEMATSLMKVTNFEDDAIQKSQGMLLTFTKIGREVFPEATEATLNMAQKFKTDASQAAIQLGKALNDPIGGVTALRRVGVMLTDQQEQQIKTFVKSGNIMAAQKVILAELSTEFGGLARAAADPFTQFQHQLGEVKEDLGMALLPAFKDVTTAIMKMIEEGNKTGDLKAGFEVLGDAAKLAAGAIKYVVDLMSVLNRMETRTGGTGTADLASTQKLKSSLEDVLRLQKEQSALQDKVAKSGNSRDYMPLIGKAEELAKARKEVERIAGTVAAPGILANLETNISALEHRIEKLKTTEKPPELAKAAKGPAGAVSSETEEQRKAREAQMAVDDEFHFKMFNAQRDFAERVRNASKKEQDEAVKADEKRTQQIYEIRQRGIEAAAGDDELKLLEAKQQKERESIVGTATETEAILTELKKTHAEERDALEADMAKRREERERNTNNAIVANQLGMAKASAQVLQIILGKSKASFAIQQAMAMAEIAVNTARAYVAALAPPPLGLGPVFGIPLANSILGLGVAQGAVVAAQTVKGFAMGTLNAPGGRAWVGERGPEMIEVPQGSRIHTATESKAMMGGGYTHNGNVVLNMPMPQGVTPSEAEGIGRAGARGYMDEMKRFKQLERDTAYYGVTA